MNICSPLHQKACEEYKREFIREYLHMTNKYEMKNITLLVIKNISTSVKSVLFPVSW